MKKTLYLIFVFLTFPFLNGPISAQDSELAVNSELWSEKSSESPVLGINNDYSVLAKSILPAVVSISIEQKAKVNHFRHSPKGRYKNPFDFFHRFFDIPGSKQGPLPPQAPQNRILQGIGSGFTITKDGLILTNNHVIDKADVIKVTFVNHDGTERTLNAEVLGTAPEYDIAVIKTLENANAPITYLGDSDKTKIGSAVMAAGNPFGLSHSVSIGIISAKERRGIRPSGQSGLYNFLQTDASINPGNSGGPLINMRGEVIGINTAINAAGSGIGFAIPINMVKEMLPDLKNKGKYTRSWIGIRIQSLTNDLAETYNLTDANGALVSQVVKDGPGEKAGLQEGDIILEFNNKKIRSSSDLPLYASMAGVNANIELKIWRNKESLNLNVVLGEYPSEEEELITNNQPADQDSNGIGITITNLTPELKKRI